MHAAAPQTKSPSNWGALSTSSLRGVPSPRRAPAAVIPFLARGRLCTGPVCTSSNTAGLTKTHESFSLGHPVCDLCANSMSTAELAALTNPPNTSEPVVGLTPSQTCGGGNQSHSKHAEANAGEELGISSTSADAQARDGGHDILPPPATTATAAPAQADAAPVARAKAQGPRAPGKNPSPGLRAARESARGKPRPSGVAKSARDDAAGILDFSLTAPRATCHLTGKSGWKALEVRTATGAVVATFRTRGTRPQVMQDARTVLAALFRTLTVEA